MTSSYQTLASRLVYENPWTRVREDQILRPNGSPGIYGVVERADFVVIVPWHNGHVTLVEQYRYPVKARMWEFPMGMWEHNPTVDPTELAAAELREETGLVAASMLRVGEIFPGPGYCNQRGHVFFATDLTQGLHEREVTEQDMICQEFSLPVFEAMVRDGAIKDAVTISAFGLLRVMNLI